MPEEIKPQDLDRAARGELRTLSKENADEVARHLVMASRLIEEDPELAHKHALAAGRRAGRVALVRESVAITAYAIGDFALALRELRTFRRISGSDDQIALMVDSERGVGRPDRALELGRTVDRATLPVEAQVGLAIAMSGARLDQGDAEAALDELERAPYDLARVLPWSADLYLAFATVNEDLGRIDDAERWRSRATTAESVLEDVDAEGSTMEVDSEDVPEARAAEAPGHAGAPAADVTEDGSVEPVDGEVVDDEPVDGEVVDGEPVDEEVVGDVLDASDDADADPSGDEPAGAERMEVEPNGAESTGADSNRAELTGIERTGVESAGAGHDGADDDAQAETDAAG